MVLPPAVQVHSHSCSLSRFLFTISLHYKIVTRHSQIRLASPNIHTTTANREDTFSPSFSDLDSTFTGPSSTNTLSSPQFRHSVFFHIIDKATNQLRDLPHRRCQACTYLTPFRAIRRGDCGFLRVFCCSWSAKLIDVWLSYDQYSRPETTPWKRSLYVADRSVIVWK